MRTCLVMAMAVAAIACAAACSRSPTQRAVEPPDVSAQESEPPVAVIAGDSETTDGRGSASSDAAEIVRLALGVESRYASARAPGADPEAPQQVTVFPGTVCVQVVVHAIVGIDDRASFSPTPPAISILTADGEPHSQLTADVRVEPVVSFVSVVDGGDPEVQRVALRASFGVEIGGFGPLAMPERVQIRATYGCLETTLWAVLVPMFLAECR